MTAEDRLQISCVRWFRYQFPDLRKMMIAVPNGGSRNILEAAKLKQMGVVAGVADLLLLTPRNGYGCLCIELKNGKRGRQSPAQHEWELSALSNGNKYVICRSVDEFIHEVTAYLESK